MFDVDKMYVIVKKLARRNGKLQVEKYLDNKNSTTEERKLAYAGRTDKGKVIKNEYRPKLKEVSEQLKELKHIATSIDEIGYELDLLAEELEIANNPTPEDVVIYKLYGKDVTTPEFKKSVEDEIASYQEQLNKLNERRDAITDNAKSKEVQVLLDKRNKLTAERDSKILETISDEEFNKIPIPQQNTKGARDNEKLDVLMGIYQNPYTAKDIMTPGGYGSIAAIAKEFNGDIKPPKDIFGVEAMDNMTIQNIQGRDLKGIAANHNSHASKRQWSKLKLGFDALFDAEVNGKRVKDREFNKLNGTLAHSVSGEKRTITRNFAEILAASVDNGKDPLLASINYNQHTADVISLLIATGADLKTVFAFINQPVIKQAVELVNLGEQRDLMSALKSIAKDRKISTKEADLKITNFNQSDLLATLKGDKNISNEANVLQSMIKYMAASKDFSNLIAASKADTKGIGKFMEEGITLMRNIKKALTLKNIQNTEEFLKGNNEEVVDGENPFDIADSLSPIEQNFRDGTSGMFMQPQFRAKSTMDLIKSGDRTRTTRANTDINRMVKDYKLSSISDLVGKIIRMTDKSGEQVYTEITKVAQLTKEYQDETWQKEGWIKDVTDKLVGKYPYAIEFKVVEKSDINTNKSIATSKIDQRFNNMFAKYGVELPINEIMSKIYPYINESFSGIKDVIEQNLGYSMTADEARLVDSMLVQFHSSKFDWYANQNKFELVKEVPTDLQSIKADYLEFTQSDEVKPLFDALTVGTDDRLGMDIIEFDNTQTASDEQRTDIKKAWQSLSNPYAELELSNKLIELIKLNKEFISNEEAVELQFDGESFNNLKAIQGLKKLDKFNNPETQKLIQDYLLDRFANNLIRYSFYTTGLNFTPKSISSLIPIGMYTDIKYNGTSMSDMVYGIQNMPNSGTSVEFDEMGNEVTSVDSGSEASRFIDQFYKHMASNPKFVPKAKFDANDKEGKNNITTIDEKKITIKPSETKNDELYTRNDDYLVPVSDYISIKVDKQDRLYRYINSGNNTELQFERVNTLGANGLIYEFDNNGGDISIIPGNNIVITKQDNNKLPTSTEVSELEDKCNIL